MQENPGEPAGSVQPAGAILVSIARLPSTLDDSEGGGPAAAGTLRALLRLAGPWAGHPLDEQDAAPGRAQIGGEARDVLVDEEEEDAQPEHDEDELHGPHRQDAEEGERRAAVAQRPGEPGD